jgi:molybdate transport system substrate-binding protein
VRDADSLRAALLAADAIYMPDPQLATAGIHFKKVMQQLGIEDTVAARVRPHPNGNAAIAATPPKTGQRIAPNACIATASSGRCRNSPFIARVKLESLKRR